jgi:hypothetical protein
MGTRRPHLVNVPISCAPRKAPCPACGKLGRRKQVLNRRVRTLEYRRVAYLDVTYGEYRARCGCCRTFRTHPPGVGPRDRYDGKVRRAVLDRILDDRMSVEAARASLRRDFLLELSDGFVYDCLRDHAATLDMADYRRWTLEGFGGVLCIDELHLGRFTLLLATDPLRDRPVAFALVDRNDADHMRRFLNNLKAHGFVPEVVVTDGSQLYPALLADLWPGARHQLCVFHVLKDINAKVLEAVRRPRRQMARRGNRGRKRRRGRPPRSRAKRKGLTKQGEVPLRLQAALPRRQTPRQLHRPRVRRLADDVVVPARTGDVAVVRGPVVRAVRRRAAVPPGVVPPGGDVAVDRVRRGPGAGRGDGDADG